MYGKHIYWMDFGFKITLELLFSDAVHAAIDTH